MSLNSQHHKTTPSLIGCIVGSDFGLRVIPVALVETITRSDEDQWLILGGLFVVIGVAPVWLVLQETRRVQNQLVQVFD